MCGICGIVGTFDPEGVARMSRALRHRGPDGLGIYRDETRHVCLGHRRLSIIDLAHGAQPMSNEDGSLWVVCNGEIYNAPALRRTLEARGHRFRTVNSDTEVLLHLYEDQSTGLLDELNGMFAFALYDRTKGRLFCARDRMGIKPFYYTTGNGRFAFASELKALLRLPWVSRSLDFGSLYHYLSLQFIPPPCTIFSHVKKLPKGHYLVHDLKNGGLSIRRYWDLKVKPVQETTEGEWIEILKEKIREAFLRWTLSDVPIACSLSGGLDSSFLVAVLASRNEEPVNTYSLGFTDDGEAELDELALAGEVARMLRTRHREILLSAPRLKDELEKMVYHLDEPYAGGLPAWYIFKHIGTDYKVALSGTGGDELFGNYGKWRCFEKGPIYLWGLAMAEALRWRVPRALWDAKRYPHGHFYHKYLYDSVKRKYLTEEVMSGIRYRTDALLENLWKRAGTVSPKDSVAYVDFHLQLPEEFLHMTDRFSMAHSVEARVPYLDHELVETVFTIPAEIRTRSDDPKWMLRKLAGPLLPSSVRSASKRGFVLPLKRWSRNDLRSWVEEMLCPHVLKSQGIFSDQLWDKIVEPHLAGQRDFTQQVWSLFMFQLWYAEFIGLP